MPQAQHNLAALLDTALPVALRHVPQRVRDVARDTGLRAALSGGIPRDLVRILAKQIDRDGFNEQLQDFDLVVEGDGVRFAYELVRRLPGKLTINAAFQTATITTEDPLRIDIATARTEVYPSPGQLPEIDTTGATLEQDALRRDFSINAIAVELSEDYGRLLDPIGGAADIVARTVRTLHAASFHDDPTRLFRALRYTLRLGYDMEPLTREQLFAAVEESALDTLTPERVRYELECVGNEPRWSDIWQAIEFSGMSAALHPALGELHRGWLTTDARALDIAIKGNRELLLLENAEAWLLRTAWVLGAADDEQLEAAAARLGLFPRQTRWLVLAREALRSADVLLMDNPYPSQICRLLERYPRQAVVVAAFTFQPRTQQDVDLRREIVKFLKEYSMVRSELTGHELRELGLPAGAALGALRDELRYLRLDNVVTDVEGELEYARRFIAEHGSSTGPQA